LFPPQNLDYYTERASIVIFCFKGTVIDSDIEFTFFTRDGFFFPEQKYALTIFSSKKLGSSLLLTLVNHVSHPIRTFLEVPIRQHLFLHSFDDTAYRAILFHLKLAAYLL